MHPDESQDITATLENASGPVFANQNSRNSTISEDVTGNESTLLSNQSELQNTVIPASTEAPATKSATESCVSPKMPMSPRTDRSHISNMIRRIAPPAPPAPSPDATGNELNLQASRTSIETHYTSSQVSLPIGPPAAHSTPYASEMMLPGGGFSPPLREQTTCRGIFDETGGTLCDAIWNVSISIPPGAIPNGRKQEIYFTVTDPRMSQTVGGPPLDMENGIYTFSLNVVVVVFVVHCFLLLFIVVYSHFVCVQLEIDG